MCIALSARLDAASPPITLATAEQKVHGKPAQIILKLIGAERTEFPSRSGRLVAAVKIGKGLWVETDIGELIGHSTMTFTDDPWEIVFADYNGDGQIDFNVGQFCGSNNSCYWLFTIDPAGSISLLPIEGTGHLWIGDDDFSTRRIETTAGAIASSGYEPVEGRFKVRYRWDGASHKFELVEKWLGERSIWRKSDAGEVRLYHDSDYGPGGEGRWFDLHVSRTGRALLTSYLWICADGQYEGDVSTSDLEKLYQLVEDMRATTSSPPPFWICPHSPVFTVTVGRLGAEPFETNACVRHVSTSPLAGLFSIARELVTHAKWSTFVPAEPVVEPRDRLIDAASGLQLLPIRQVNPWK